MIERRTGTLRFDEPGAVITAHTTRSAFLADAVWKHERFGPSAFKAGEFQALGRRFVVIVYFEGERLSSVDLAEVDPKYGASWEDWSEIKELQRKASHDAVLKQELGRRARFGWGSASSTYDQRSGGSQLSIRFGSVPRAPVPITSIAAALLFLGAVALGFWWR